MIEELNGMTALVTGGSRGIGRAIALPQLRPDQMPVGRFGTFEEVAEVSVMLARNGYITGQTVGVNGGRYLC